MQRVSAPGRARLRGAGELLSEQRWTPAAPPNAAFGHRFAEVPVRAPDAGARPIVQRRRVAVPSQPRRPLDTAAAIGFAGARGPLPHLAAIQRSFGRHDLSEIESYADASAAEGAMAMGAEAFASGRRVAFARAPSLHLAAHEAAHVVQQRAGVATEDDRHERQADAVADAVVQGLSSEALLDHCAAGAAPRPAATVQRRKTWVPSDVRERTGLPAFITTEEWTADALERTIAQLGDLAKGLSDPKEEAVAVKVAVLKGELSDALKKKEFRKGAPANLDNSNLETSSSLKGETTKVAEEQPAPAKRRKNRFEATSSPFDRFARADKASKAPILDPKGAAARVDGDTVHPLGGGTNLVLRPVAGLLKDEKKFAGTSLAVEVDGAFQQIPGAPSEAFFAKLKKDARFQILTRIDAGLSAAVELETILHEVTLHVRPYLDFIALYRNMEPEDRFNEFSIQSYAGGGLINQEEHHKQLAKGGNEDLLERLQILLKSEENQDVAAGLKAEYESDVRTHQHLAK